jgi:hypothetical protein
MPTTAKKTSLKITRARIFERLKSSRIDLKESIPPAYVALRAGTIICRIDPPGYIDPRLLKRLQIRGLTINPTAEKSVFIPYVRFLDSFRVVIRYGVFKSDLIIKKTETEFANI